MNTLEKSIVLGFIITVLFSFTSFEKNCESVTDKVLRLHIIANSDYEYDQSLKLKVRDRILNYSGEIFKSASNKDDAQVAASENIDGIKRVALDEIHSQGYDYPVNVEITNMYFTTRTYDTVTLPAGNYDAIRISIGEGKGHNWWCVMFPQLCLGSSRKDEVVDEVLSTEESNIVKGKDRYEIKFKIVEFFQSIKNWVCSLFKK